MANIPPVSVTAGPLASDFDIEEKEWVELHNISETEQKGLEEEASREWSELPYKS